MFASIHSLMNDKNMIDNYQDQLFHDQSQRKYGTGPGSNSRGREFDPGPVPYFRGD